MNIFRIDLWTWRGRIDRAEYSTLGVLLFAIKYNVDRLVAAAPFHRSWYIFNYWIPGVNARRGGIPRGDWPFFVTLLLLSLPFIWSGGGTSLHILNGRIRRIYRSMGRAPPAEVLGHLAACQHAGTDFLLRHPSPSY